MAGLFDGLASLESRHAELDLESIRSDLDRDPERAWRTLVEKYSRFVFSMALRASSGLTDPEEFAAEIYRRVFDRLQASDHALVRRFEGRCDFRSYLFRMVKTERFRLFRRRGVETRAAETLAAESASVAPPDEPTWPSSLGRAAATAALRALSDEDRRLLVLRFAGGLKLRELADFTGARDTNDAAYRLRKTLGKCDALRRARASPDWDEGAFREALRAIQADLFPEEAAAEVQNPTAEVSDPIEHRQGERP